MKSQGGILIFWQLIHQFGRNFYPTSDTVDNSLSLVFGQFTFAMNAYGHHLSLNQFCSIWSMCCEHEQTMNMSKIIGT